MCNFLSVLILRNGDVLHHPMLDSHADLVAYFDLPDTRDHHQHFAKAELVPDGDILNPSKWKWAIDEPTRPGWLDDVERCAEEKTRSIAKRMVLTDQTKKLPKIIIDGCWIIGGSVKLSNIRGGRIYLVGGSAQILEVGDSAQIHGVWSSVLLDSSAKAHVVKSGSTVDYTI